MVNVLIVEDQIMLRDYLADCLVGNPRFTLTRSIGNAAMAEIVCMQQPIDLILMDVCTEQNESGLVAAAQLKKQFPDIKIIIITSMAEHSFIERAREAGADSFWYKDASQEELLTVMERTMNGESIYPNVPRIVEIGKCRSSDFTKRELAVLRLIVEGQTDAMIAEDLGVSAAAVRYHVNNMLDKTGYANRVQLAVAVSNSTLVLPGF